MGGRLILTKQVAPVKIEYLHRRATINPGANPLPSSLLQNIQRRQLIELNKHK